MLRDAGRSAAGAAGSLAERQEKWLLDCLARNAGCEYGRRHGFAAIRSTREYQSVLPMTSYEVLAPSSQRMAQGERDVLFAGTPAGFERTGGSTGGAKLIPYSLESLRDFRVAILPWLAAVIDRYGLGRGCGYFSISPATRAPEVTPSGIAVGLPDGAYLGRDLLPALVELSAVPPGVGAIADVSTWRLVTLYWLARSADLELVSVWSPTFFLTLLDALAASAEELRALLHQGAEMAGMTLGPDSDAADRVRAFAADRDARVLWPHLRLVSCWADASSAPYFAALRARLPQAAFEGKGLLATEGVVTVPDPDGRPVLAADSGFFEFIAANGAVELATDLRSGNSYEVVMTTAGGLYRYRTGDCVACEGFTGDLPRLRFIGRSGLVSDLVGEKLTERFVASCLDGLDGFRMLVPYAEAVPGYALVVDERPVGDDDAIARVVEARLAANPQYAYARRLGQLAPLRVMRARAPLEAYLGRVAKQGVRLGDIKVPSLRAERDWIDTYTRISA